MARLIILGVFLAIGLVACAGPLSTLSRKQQASENARRRQPESQTAVETKADNEDDTSDKCPEPNGFFPDADQCDKYYDCREGRITEKLCADGLVFNDYSPEYETCDLPFNIDCSKRSKLQTPNPSEHCPRKHGYFAHETSSICDIFYYCVDGKYNMITCPNGLVYNQKAGICSWPDEAKKTGCSSKDVFQFECPKVDEQEAVSHPRYPDPDDCQFFYVCINGVTPRRNGCKLGQAFDESRKVCEWARKVPECVDWYKGILTDAQLDALENPPVHKTKPNKQSSRPSRRRPSKNTTPAAEEEEDEE